MPAGFVINETRSIVLSRGWGVLTGRDMIAHARALAADPRFRPHFSQLFDFRDITRIELTDAVIRAMADLSPFGAGSKRAPVVGSEVAYGLARMYEILRSNSAEDMVVFRDMDAALDWLGVADAKDELLSALLRVPIGEMKRPADAEIDLSTVNSPRELHGALALALGCPEGYGHDWDAFRKRIANPAHSSVPERLTLKGFTAFAYRLPRDAAILLKCFEDLNAIHPELACSLTRA